MWATIPARAAEASGISVRRRGYVALLRGEPWQGAGGRTSIMGCSVEAHDVRVTIVTVPLEGRVAEQLRGVCVELESSAPGSRLADAWPQVTFERGGRELGVRVSAAPDQDELLLWHGAAERMQAFVGHAREVHRRLDGARS